MQNVAIKECGNAPDACFQLTHTDRAVRRKVIRQLLAKGVARDTLVCAFGAPAVQQAEMVIATQEPQ